MWYVIGIIFIVSSIVGLVQYGFVNFLVCFLIGVFLIANGYLKSKSKKPSAVLSDHKDKSYTFSVVGVTFRNDDGSDRQYLLRKIYFRDPPFDDHLSVSLEKYQYNDKPAYYVKVNDKIIGNIPADYVWYFDKNYDRPCTIELNVYGGGTGKNYGAEIHGSYTDL